MTKLTPEQPLIQRKGQLKYEQLKRILLDQMNSGRLQPGDMLPPEVDLAQQMGVARNTVRQAMRDLEDRHMIRRIRGKGTIVCETPPVRAEPTPEQPAVGQLFGLVIPELRAGMYQSMQAGLNNALSSLSGNLIVCDSGQDLAKQTDALLQLAHRGVSGVAMVPITTEPTQPHQVSFLQKLGVPLVFCHRGVEGVSAPLVGFSPLQMGHAAAAELARHGHRRIGMIFSHRSASCTQRVHGAREAMAEAGGSAPEDFIYYDRSVRAEAFPPGIEDRLAECLTAMLASDQPPTGLVVSADSLAGLTCMVLQKLGHRVPQDVSVIGFGDRWNRTSALPWNLRSVTVDEWQVGQIAFETLGKLRGGGRPTGDDESVTMPLEISEGDSVGPAPD
jgi:DNA-binding LacI/PurR family transcriptional regulator